MDEWIRERFNTREILRQKQIMGRGGSRAQIQVRMDESDINRTEDNQRCVTAPGPAPELNSLTTCD